MEPLREKGQNNTITIQPPPMQPITHPITLSARDFFVKPGATKANPGLPPRSASHCLAFPLPSSKMPIITATVLHKRRKGTREGEQQGEEGRGTEPIPADGQQQTQTLILSFQLSLFLLPQWVLPPPLLILPSSSIISSSF